ncbi:MAG: hypothetical protein ACRCX8_12620 [Sarcina sp.]
MHSQKFVEIQNLINLNPSSFDSINSNVIVLLDWFKSIDDEVESSSFLIENFRYTKPDLVILPMFYREFSLDVKKNIFGNLRTLQVNTRLEQLLQSFTYELSRDTYEHTFDLNIKNLFIEYISNIEFQYLDLNSLIDDIKELILYIKDYDELDITVTMDYLKIVKDQSYNDFLDFTRCLEKENRDQIIFIVVSHLYMNYLNKLIKTYKNQNNLIVKYVFNYRNLEMMKNDK